ncbi:reelin-like isoform X3 [Artemia franciscana]|uniref:reelin-like isoform X3 n=1 Tax=Artemia franciscana TaxID=6661 RepID=UPI0032DBC04C
MHFFFIFLTFPLFVISQSPLSFVSSPFYFVCQHGDRENPYQGIIPSITIAGADSVYESGKLYQVTLQSTEPFDALLVTGVQKLLNQFPNTAFGGLPGLPVGGSNAGNLCSLVYSHQSRRLQTKANFFWQAPPKGTGCVDFIVTLVREMRIVMKDVKVHEICEKEEGTAVLPPVIESDGSWIFLKEGFEQENPGYYSNLTTACSGIGHGASAVLCSDNQESILEYQNISVNGESRLEFWGGMNICEEDKEARLQVSILEFVDERCTDVQHVFELRLKDVRLFSSFLLPKNISGSICLQFLSDYGCVIIDDILLYKAREDDFSFQDDFETLNVSHFTTLSGTAVRKDCASSSSALIFSANENWRRIAITKDIYLTNGTNVIQFSINMHCDKLVDSALLLSYSTDHGKSWKTFNAGEVIIDRLERSNFFQWERVTLLFPEDVNGPIRVKFESEETKGKSAIDSLFIGPCSGCNNHGSCFLSGAKCRCDVEYSGENCEKPEASLPDTFLENFEKKITSSSVVSKFSGVKTSYEYGIIHSGKSSVFEGPESLLETFEFDGRSNASLKLIAQALPQKFGNESGVIKIYGSCNGGIHWYAVGALNDDSFLSSSQFNAEIPHELKCSMLKFLIKCSGSSLWLLDSFSLQIDNQDHMENTNGEKGAWCEKESVLKFILKNETGYLEYGPIRTTVNSVISFELAIGCVASSSQDLEFQVRIEYSLDQGISWTLLSNNCSNSDCYGVLWNGSRFTKSHFSSWKRVHIHLPPQLRNQDVKFRLIEWNPFNNSVMWSVDHLFIGHNCPSSCNGFGSCTSSGCICDPGYIGIDCRPITSNASEIIEDFEKPILNVSLIGGSVIDEEIFSGKSAILNYTGLREVITKDVFIQELDHIGFYMKSQGRVTHQAKQFVSFLYSLNGGLAWKKIQDFDLEDFYTPRYIRLPPPLNLPKGGIIRFKWWQIAHSDDLIWFIDHVSLRIIIDGGTLSKLSQVLGPNSVFWASRTNYSHDIQSEETPSLIFAGSEEVGIAMLDNVLLTEESIFQFEIKVEDKLGKSPVHLELSVDNGLSWKLFQESCTPSNRKLCGVDFVMPSVYYHEETEKWNRFTIFPDVRVQNRRVLVRWKQVRSSLSEKFSLRNIYFGIPCSNLCSGFGVCTAETDCLCDDGFSGFSCETSSIVYLAPLFQNFENSEFKEMFPTTSGGRFFKNEFEGYADSYLNFSLAEPRFLITKPLKAINLRFIKFFTSFEYESVINDERSVILDMSDSNGQTWTNLGFYKQEGTYVVEIPPQMRVNLALLRFWQPYLEDKCQPWWILDNFELIPSLIDTESYSNNGTINELWRETVKGTQLLNGMLKLGGLEEEFSEVYASTRDFEITKNSFLQFELLVEESLAKFCTLRLDSSADFGKSWNILRKACVPSDTMCSKYDLESIYLSTEFPDWRKITLPIRRTNAGSKMRFRIVGSSSLCSFLIRHMTISTKCPWMCSGRGICVYGVCSCDDGYSGPYCVPSETLSLPQEIYLTFDSFKMEPELRNIEGARLSRGCGVVSSGRSLNFEKAGRRLLETFDMDLTSAESLQLILKFGCSSLNESLSRSRNSGVLLQHTSNNGAEWSTIMELPYKLGKHEVIVPLASYQQLKSNSSRLRLWQPLDAKDGESVWSIDDLILTTHTIRSQAVGDDFEEGIKRAVLIHSIGGKIGSFCNSSSQVLLFNGKERIRLAITRDIHVEEGHILQFQIKAGCGKVFQSSNPIHLEYSSNFGKTWLRTKIYDDDKSLYYANQSPKWQKYTIHISDLRTTGLLRFRWIQEASVQSGIPVAWALDNIYIGYSCNEDCNGHGLCSLQGKCYCDEGYTGDSCEDTTVTLLNHVHEGFENLEVNRTIFNDLAGASITDLCSYNSGSSLYFSGNTARFITTNPLNLTYARFLQFMVNAKCSHSDSIPRVAVQYSVNGGVKWNTLKIVESSQLYFERVIIDVPLPAKRNNVLLRWVQLGVTGSWALDEIFVQAEPELVPWLNFDDRNDSFFSISGAKYSKICQSNISGWHFIGGSKNRYAVTKDFNVNDDTILQFELSTGCDSHAQCFGITLDYSSDGGKSWNPAFISKENSEDNVFQADLNFGRKRHTLYLSNLIEYSPIRLRWNQVSKHQSSTSWALSNIYIGTGCVGGCTNRGRCVEQMCLCDEGWEGEDCSHPSELQPGYIWDDLSDDEISKHWNIVVGGSIIDGDTVSQLVFDGNCSRYIESHPIDFTTSSPLLQFNLNYFSPAPKNENADIVLEYSVDGGIRWMELTIFQTRENNKNVLENCILPKEARVESILLRMLQPITDSKKKRPTWALSHIRFGAPIFFLDSITNGYNGGHPNNLLWTKRVNVQTFTREDAELLMLRASENEPSYIETVDLIGPITNSALQFEYFTVTKRKFFAPANVKLQVSFDYGASWQLVGDECYSVDILCNGTVDVATIYTPSSLVRRVTIPLDSVKYQRVARFRFFQDAASFEVNWVIKSFYIGPSCPKMCFNQGTCNYPECVCDKGFYGESCQFSDTSLVSDGIDFKKFM